MVFRISGVSCGKGKVQSLADLRRSYDPAVLTVLLEDTAALIGLSVALIGLYLAHLYNNPYFDGAASILIGITLCAVSVILIRGSKGLLVGEAATPEVLASVTALTLDEPAVKGANHVLTLVFGPEEVLLNIEAQVVPSLSVGELAEIVSRLESAIQRDHPIIRRIFIEVASDTARPI